MPIQILFSAPEASWPSYEPSLKDALQKAGITDFHLARAIAPAEVDYIVLAPNGPVQDFAPYTKCKAVLA